MRCLRAVPLVDESLGGRTAIVTGAASGIGWAVSRALSHGGATVHLCDSNAQVLREREAELGPSCASHDLDVTDEGQVEEVFGRIGKVDIMVHSAGGGGLTASVRDTRLEDWTRVVGLNLTGAFLVTRQAVRHMADNGSIVLIASINSVQPAAGMAAYCAAKAAVAMLTKVTALECAPSNVRVNAVAPGLVDTPLTVRFTTSDVLEDFRANTPLGRVGQPEDVARAVLFLASDEARWVTGQVLHVDGGAHMKAYPDVLGTQ